MDHPTEVSPGQARRFLAVLILFVSATSWKAMGQTIGEYGCALTSLVMALRQRGEKWDPGTLNEELSRLHDDYVGATVNWGPAVRDVSKGRLLFRPFVSRRGSDIFSRLQDRSSVIVGVKLSRHGEAQHFVVAVGGSPDAILIIDPARGGKQLHESLSKFADFEARGTVEPASGYGDLGELDIAVDGRRELLVTDAKLRQTGAAGPGGPAGIVKGIPGSVYFRDAISNDATGGPPLDGASFIYISRPESDSYAISVAGPKDKRFHLSVREFSRDGTAQPALHHDGVIREEGQKYLLRLERRTGEKGFVLSRSDSPRRHGVPLGRKEREKRDETSETADSGYLDASVAELVEEPKRYLSKKVSFCGFGGGGNLDHFELFDDPIMMAVNGGRGWVGGVSVEGTHLAVEKKKMLLSSLDSTHRICVKGLFRVSARRTWNFRSKKMVTLPPSVLADDMEDMGRPGDSNTSAGTPPAASPGIQTAAKRERNELNETANSGYLAMSVGDLVADPKRYESKKVSFCGFYNGMNLDYFNVYGKWSGGGDVPVEGMRLSLEKKEMLSSALNGFHRVCVKGLFRTKPPAWNAYSKKMVTLPPSVLADDVEDMGRPDDKDINAFPAVSPGPRGRSQVK